MGKIVPFPADDYTVRRHTGRPLPTYRIRARKCKDCRTPFDSIEMAKEYLDALLKELALARKRDARLRALVVEADKILGASKRLEAVNRFKKRR